MAKAAIYAEDAKRLFVMEGLSLDAILGRLGNKVSRKTLFNWKKEGDWDEKRSEFLAQNKDTREQLKNILNLTLKNAEAVPTPKNIRAVISAIQAYESYGGIRPQIESTGAADKPARSTYWPETIEAIKGLYGLK